MSEQTTAEVPADEPLVAPVEGEAPQETKEPQDADTGDDDAPADPPKPKGGFQRRIAELTHNWRETERDRDYWREVALRNVNQPPQRSEPNPLDPRSYANGDRDVAYIAAVAREEARRELEAEQARERQEAQARTFQEKVADFRSRVSDQDEGAWLLLSDPSAPVTQEMAEAIVGSDVGVKVADHLGRNPAEARRIASLPPHLQGYEIAKLESRVSAPVRPSAAPPPPPTVGGRASASSGYRDDMTLAEYEAWRAKR